MAIYWVLLLLPSLGAVLAMNHFRACSNRYEPSQNATKTASLTLGLFALLLVLVVGFRHEVGGDWFNYLNSLATAEDQTWFEGMVSAGDPAYGLLTWLSAKVGGGIYLVNVACAFVFVAGLLDYVRNSPQPWLMMCVAVPYLVIVVAMGYTRQGVAIGLAMVGLVALNKGQLYKFAGWLILAALFHKSALIMLPMAIFSGRKDWIALLGILLVGAMMFILLLAEHVDNLVTGYVTDKYASSGAGIRVAMNAVPAVIFLLFRNRFNLTPSQKSFWVWMSLGALIFILLLVVSPSSTAVDRVALYWIPLQLFVFSRLPQAMGQSVGTQRQWVAIVVLYAFAVQFVWLFYADHSYAWLPYQFYPWIWLWS
jgi:hypothetical protein